ncbi:3-mercaptopyruvate sulfurtransferase [Notothenia coriiceps]|uniref:Sulfurtransferase n=1 Tax=Notothenia coriiceps TaxID=8208 RepID=A0A6I9N121_9TELE|nr:PREDICTED: thiosulfate sulfurtransferase-like [Notothenia coriiceps]XP_010769224.1 PREDICTED: thiosulfate sulfurtransferase-like [Notothenia coriiceps]
MGLQAQTLVSAKWLANMANRNLVGPGLRILDTSWYLPMMNRDAKKEFAETHIPGASFFDIDECSDRTSKFDHTLPNEQFFADYVGNLGIGNDSHVVVYDASDFGAFSCTRVWWMFRLFGHPQVSVLNGGFRDWVKRGHPTTGTYSRPEAARFTATMERSWVKSFEDMTKNINRQQFQVVDVRPRKRFLGWEPEPRADVKSGHIPGSKCMPFWEFLDKDGMMLSPEKLKEFFEQSQIDLNKPLCGTCGSGVTACHMVLAAHLCGAPWATVYDGSWYEWFTKAPPEHVATEVKPEI